MRIVYLCMLLLSKFYLFGQPFVHIGTIAVEGNKKTRSEIILRELLFQEHDSIPASELIGLFRKSEQMLMNTGLFSRVFVNESKRTADNTVEVKVIVSEAWYLYPVPLFELADRNFNVWWVEQNRSLQRVNFGIEFAHLNISGRMDRLKIGFKHGYTHNYSIKYTLPYINRQQTIGISAEASFARNKEVNYATEGNKQLFYRDEHQFLYATFRTELGLTYRPAARSFHNFYISYHQNQVSDIIVNELNPSFFLNGRSIQRYLSFNYQFTYDNRDIRPYPLSGNYLSLRLERDGLDGFKDRDALTLFAYYDQYFSMSDRWSLALKTGGKVSMIRNAQPYNDNRAIGFGKNYLHGYEYYVVDGLDMGFVKTNLRFQLLKEELGFGKIVPIQAFRRMPVKIYLSANNDFGYVNEPFTGTTNFLNNRLLWGGGLGLDFVLYNDKVFQIEYSMNHLLERALFVNVNLNI